MEELEIREFISIDTVPRDSYDWYVHLLMNDEKTFKKLIQEDIGISKPKQH